MNEDSISPSQSPRRCDLDFANIHNIRFRWVGNVTEGDRRGRFWFKDFTAIFVVFVQ
jgi:hypothetical protein